MGKWFWAIAFLLIVLPKTVFATNLSLDQVNQKVCDRFEQDVSRLAAIMDEVRRTKGITQTRVAFGGVDTPIKSADYQITYAAEALAYQRVKKYSNQNNLRYSLEVLKNKILTAKSYTKKATDYAR